MARRGVVQVFALAGTIRILYYSLYLRAIELAARLRRGLQVPTTPEQMPAYDDSVSFFQTELTVHMLMHNIRWM